MAIQLTQTCRRTASQPNRHEQEEVLSISGTKNVVRRASSCLLGGQLTEDSRMNRRDRWLKLQRHLVRRAEKQFSTLKIMIGAAIPARLEFSGHTDTDMQATNSADQKSQDSYTSVPMRSSSDCVILAQNHHDMPPSSPHKAWKAN